MFLFINAQVLLGLIFLIAFTAAKAVEQEDQTAEASQTSSKTVIQQRLDFLGHGHADHHHDHIVVDHHHHHEEPDPGYWKKKLIWKEGWKKIWNPAKKQIWKPAWKKIYKPIWVSSVVHVYE